MRRFLLTSIAAFTLALPAAAGAQDGKSVLDLPAGQTVINLSVTERVEVDQDLLVATLRYEAENTDPRALQDEINAVMKKALAAADETPDVKAATQQYYVHAVDPESSLPEKLVSGDRKPARLWRGSQGITVRGEKADALLALAGRMQDMGLVMNGLSYTLSPAKADEVQDSLMEAALAKLRTKAGRAAKALGKAEAGLLEVNVDSGGYHPQPVMMRGAAMAKMDSMAAPVAAAGQTEITMTVSARALLK